MGDPSAGSRPSLLVCDGPCCGPLLSEALATLKPEARVEVATCLSDCEKAPVVRLRYDTGQGSRETALLSGREEPDLAGELRAWTRAGAPAPLTPRLRAARFAPGEGGGCLCDEGQPPAADAATEGEAPPG